MKIDRTKCLINGEAHRHISQALVASEPALKRSHMEVAAALTLAVVALERRPAEPTAWKRAIMKALKIY